MIRGKTHKFNTKGDVESKKTLTTWTVGSGVAHQQVGNTWFGESSTEGIVSLSVGGDLNVFDPRVSDKPSRILYVSTLWRPLFVLGF